MQKELKPTKIQMKGADGSSSERTIFPCAMVSYNGVEVPVQLLKNNPTLTAEENLNNSTQNIEFELVKTIFNLTNKHIDKIAFLEGHGELNELETGDITKELSYYYQVDRGVINGKPGILDAYKAIVIAKPTKSFSEQDKLIIDQYIMRGGKVIWFIDEVNVSIDSLANGATFGFISPLNLDDQLFTYGARINPNLIQDIQCNILPVQAGMNGNQPRWVPAPWLYYPLLAPLVVHPVTRDLNLIFSRFASTIDTVGEGSGIKKTVLLKTSSYTKTVNAPIYISLDEVKNNPVKEEFNKPNQTVALLLEGQFKSVFRNRNAGQIIPGWKDKLQSLSIPNKMIIVADGDMIANDVRMTAKGPMITALGYDKYSRQSFGNKEFIVNAINFLVDENGLIEMRSKEFKLRLLDKKRLSEEKVKWKVINTLVPVIIVLLFAMFFQYRRKRKYTS
jgi:gliding-associated putative ABC transporter substrate-binding component GldG